MAEKHAKIVANPKQILRMCVKKRQQFDANLNENLLLQKSEFFFNRYTIIVNERMRGVRERLREREGGRETKQKTFPTDKAWQEHWNWKKTAAQTARDENIKWSERLKRKITEKWTFHI